jgi:small-conductance mechanosensitive channel
MQQIFNDLISGLILLIEGSVRVNDILDVDGDILKVKKIGVRASEVVNRDDVDVIMPNSRLVSNKIINLSHTVQNVRFIITIGVAYGSNVDKVINLLESSAKEHKDVYSKNAPRARLVDFGESSLDFELLFWSSNMFRIKNVQSDIRRTIVKKFELNNIQIPFPQRDIHIKK